MDLVADRLIEYRGDVFATLCSAKATNEDGYVQQKLARLVLQSNHIDHCTRLCHSPSVEAMIAALGSGATSNSYVDYEEAGCLVIIGSDADSNHPVAAARMRHAVVERGAKLIVINPRRIGMCDYADLWIRERPGTDVALLNAMAKVILDEKLLDESFVEERTEGFDEWLAVVEKYDLEYAEKITGVPAAQIAGAARMYARPPFGGSCMIWGMGITQHTNGTANVHGLLNLALATRTDRQAGQRRIAAQGPEQRPGLRRRRMHSRLLHRLSAHRAGDRAQVRGRLGQQSPAAGGRDGGDRHGRSGAGRPAEGHVHHR